jgi:hypothetical protein
LSPEQKHAYRQSARQHHRPGDEPSQMWHPVSRAEAYLMNREARRANV